MGFVPFVAQAQQGSVEVTTTYTPDIAPATKLLAPTTIADDPRIDPDIAYQVTPSLWQISLDAHHFNPARASYWDYTSYKRLYAKAAIGYPLGSEARLHYTLQQPKVGYIGVGIDHVGDFAARSNALNVARSIADSYSMNNRANVGGGLFVGNNYLLEGALLYDSDIYNSYAADSPEHLVFHDARLGVKFGDEFVDLSHLNFSLEAHGDYWSHRLPMMAEEQEIASVINAGGSVKFARDFQRNIITLDLEADWWGGNYRQELAIGGSVGYARRFGFVQLEAGLGYMFDKVADNSASHYILPRVKVLLDLQKVAFVPYFEAKSSVQHNTLSKLYKINPFLGLEPQSVESLNASNTLSYDISLGFTGTLFSSRFAYHLFAGANFMRDQLFWYIKEPGLFGFRTGNNNRIFVGVGAEVTPVAGLKIDLDFCYHFDNHYSEYEQSEPNMRGNIGVEYMLRKWKFYVKGDLRGAQSWSHLPAADESQIGVVTMPASFDLGLGVSYRINRHIEIYADGENLINNRIYDFADYYRQGAGFMLGIKMDF
jgi:hypothetical protein